MDIQEQQTIQSLISEISGLCFEISNQGLAHCMCQLFGHVKQLEVYAYPSSTDYKSSHSRTRIINRKIYVDGLDPDTIDQLKDTIKALKKVKTTNQGLAA